MQVIAGISILHDAQVLGEQPRIDGVQRVGGSLYVQPGDLTGVLSYQWFADGAEIVAETSDTYVPPMMMQHIHCRVTGDQGVFETPAVWIYHNHADPSHNSADDRVLALVPHVDCTHIAIADGAWSASATWDAGQVPGPGAVVLVPHGRTVTYDVVASPRLDRVRVDGKLEWARDRSTHILVETIIATVKGEIEMGAPGNRMPLDYDTVVEFSDRSYRLDLAESTLLDIDHDPDLVSRGLLHHGKWTAWGAAITPWLRTSPMVQAPMAGDTAITLERVPSNWSVGDTLVIGSTFFVAHQGVPNDENERRTITAINGLIVTLDAPLIYDHDHQNPNIIDPGDLRPPVFNTRRNITLRSEAAHEAEPHKRAHTMSMHGNASPDLWSVAFLDMGRTDKSRFAGIKRDGLFTFYSGNSQQGGNPPELSTAPFTADANLQSRYPIHMHFCGYGRGSAKPVIRDCYVENAPAWAYVHHGCEADFFDNVGHRFVGAGMVSETADELGAWVGNLMCGTRQGFNGDVASAGNPKNVEGTVARYGDFAKTGMGMFFRGRAMRVNRNMVSGCPSAYVFFHRANSSATTQMSYKRKVPREHVDVSGLAYLDWESGYIDSNDYPIRHFDGNECCGIQGYGFAVTKSASKQNHDLAINIRDNKFWAIGIGGHMEYIGTYNFVNTRLYATARATPGKTKTGFILSGEQLSNVGNEIVGFKRAYHVWGKGSADDGTSNDDWNNTNNPLHFISGNTLTNNVENFDFFDLRDGYPANSNQPVSAITRIQATTPAEIPPTLSGPFILYDWNGAGDGVGTITNTGSYIKTDTVGAQTLPKVWDPTGLWHGQANSTEQNKVFTGSKLIDLAGRDGYWTYQGDNIVVFPHYISDRTTGRPAVNTIAVRCTGDMSGYTLNGEFTLSAAGPVRADITQAVGANGSVTVDVLSAATGEAGAVLSVYRDRLKPNHGELEDAASGSVTYTPDLGYFGDDECFLFVRDGRGRYDTVKITFTVS